MTRQNCYQVHEVLDWQRRFVILSKNTKYLDKIRQPSPTPAFHGLGDDWLHAPSSHWV